MVVVWAEFLNETTGEVSGCLDMQLQRTVPIGEWYHSHNCEICLCSPSQRMCKQVYCAPPESCQGFLQADPSPNVCCDICVPVVVEREQNRDGMNLRLGIGTVVLFFLLFLLLFAYHRLRNKRSFARCHLRGRSEDSGEAGPDSVGTTETDAVVCLDGYAFPEAPPPYQTRIPSPTLSLQLLERPRTATPPLSPPLGEPPPPYATLPPATLPISPASPAVLPPLSITRPNLSLQEGIELEDYPPLPAWRSGSSPSPRR